MDCSRGLSDISIAPGCLTYPGAIGAGKGPSNRTLFVPIHFAAQPGAGEGPVALGGAQRNVEGLRRLLEREAGEEVELDDLGHARLLSVEVFQGFVESDQLLVRRRADQLALEQINALPVAAALEALLRARLLDQDAAHRFRGGEKKVATVGKRSRPGSASPVSILLPALHQSQVRFMDQGRGIERLPRLLVRELLGRQFAQLLVDQRQELLGGGRIALLDGGQDARDVAHAVKHNRRGGARPAAGRVSTRGGRVPGQKQQPPGVIDRAAGCPSRDWRWTLSGSKTRFFSALQDTFTGRLRSSSRRRRAWRCSGRGACSPRPNGLVRPGAAAPGNDQSIGHRVPAPAAGGPRRRKPPGHGGSRAREDAEKNSQMVLS